MKIENKKLFSQFIVGFNMYEEKECRDCLLLPICSGGCPLHRLKNKTEATDYNLCTTRKDNLNKFLEYHYAKRKLQNEDKITSII